MEIVPRHYAQIEVEFREHVRKGYGVAKIKSLTTSIANIKSRDMK